MSINQPIWYPCQHRDHHGEQLPLPGLSAPRPCITGAQIPGHSAKIDWLEFTVKNVPPHAAIRSYLNGDPAFYVLADRGMAGYSDLLEHGAVRVLYTQERPDRGTKIILSATALDEIGRDAIDILRSVLADGGTIARIDIAMDDRLELLDLDVMEHSVHSGECVSHFSKFRPFREFDLKKKCCTGHGLYWGSRVSGRIVRAYDKRLERIHKFGENDPGHWIRVEVECHKRAAMSVVLRLVESGISSIPGIIRGAIDFRDVDSDGKSTRRESLPWWDVFFDGVCSVRTGLKKNITSMADRAVWLARQVRRSLAMLLCAYGPENFRNFLSDGVVDLTQRDIQLLELSNPNIKYSQYFDAFYNNLFPVAGERGGLMQIVPF